MKSVRDMIVESEKLDREIRARGESLEWLSDAESPEVITAEVEKVQSETVSTVEEMNEPESQTEIVAETDEPEIPVQTVTETQSVELPEEHVAELVDDDQSSLSETYLDDAADTTLEMSEFDVIGELTSSSDAPYVERLTDVPDTQTDTSSLEPLERPVETSYELNDPNVVDTPTEVPEEVPEVVDDDQPELTDAETDGPSAPELETSPLETGEQPDVSAVSIDDPLSVNPSTAETEKVEQPEESTQELDGLSVPEEVPEVVDDAPSVSVNEQSDLTEPESVGIETEMVHDTTVPPLEAVDLNPTNDVVSVDSGELSDVPFVALESPVIEAENLPDVESRDLEESSTTDSVVQAIADPDIPDITASDIDHVSIPELSHSEPESVSDPELSINSIEDVPADSQDTQTTDDVPATDVAQMEVAEFDQPDVVTSQLDDPTVPDQQIADISRDDATAVSSSEMSDPEDPQVTTVDTYHPDAPDVFLSTIQKTSEPPLATVQYEPMPESAMSSTTFDELPERNVSVGGIDEPNEPHFKSGFQAFHDLPDMTQAEAQAMELSDPNLSEEQRSVRQFEMQANNNRDLAEQLRQELDPAFDELRLHQTQSVHDYVQSQTLLTALMRPRG